MILDYAVRLTPCLKTLVWGTESWEASVRGDSPTTAANGPLAGKALSEIVPDFPLLVKVIDAKNRLSVQVHPNNANAALTGGEPKTEMWCVIEGGPIYAGLKPGVGPAEVESAVKSGAFEELLVCHDAKPGDVFFIPGGLVHAIGDGVKLFEVQQSSETTYRLYDWGRVGADGKPRQLHIAESLKSIDFSLPVPDPRGVKTVDCPYFRFVRLDAGERFRTEAAATVVHYPASAETWLLPAGSDVEGPAFVASY